LAYHGLANATDVLIAVNRRDIHRQLESDFVDAVHMRRDVDVHTDVDVVELRIDQRVDAHAADARLERSGRNRHAFTDLQGGFLPVRRTNFRLLDELAAAVAHQEV